VLFRSPQNPKTPIFKILILNFYNKFANKTIEIIIKHNILKIIK